MGRFPSRNFLAELHQKWAGDRGKEFENALNIHSVEDTAYLEELSGWSLRPIEEGSARTRFFPRQ